MAGPGQGDGDGEGGAATAGAVVTFGLTAGAAGDGAWLGGAGDGCGGAGDVAGGLGEVAGGRAGALLREDAGLGSTTTGDVPEPGCVEPPEPPWPTRAAPPRLLPEVPPVVTPRVVPVPPPVPETPGPAPGALRVPTGAGVLRSGAGAGSTRLLCGACKSCIPTAASAGISAVNPQKPASSRPATMTRTTASGGVRTAGAWAGVEPEPSSPGSAATGDSPISTSCSGLGTAALPTKTGQPLALVTSKDFTRRRAVSRWPASVL